MKARIPRSVPISLLLAAAFCSAAASPAPAPGGGGAGPQPGQRPPDPNTFTIIGKIASFNRTPRGVVEGLMLRSPSGGLAQINITYELTDAIGKIPLGDAVEATVLPDNPPPGPEANGPDRGGPGREGRGPGPRGAGPGERGPREGGPREGGPREGGPRGRGPRGDEGPPPQADNTPNLAPDFFPQFPTAYIAQTEIPVAAPAAPPPPPPAPHRAAHPIFHLVSLKDSKGNRYAAPEHQPITVDSTLAAINYNQRGEVDGLQLANGDFVRLNPQAFAANLAPNDKVSVQGMALPLPGGAHIIDAQTINGQPAQFGRPNTPPGPNGPDNRGPADRRPNDPAPRNPTP